jgi:dipeptidyl aminopeptidase/acylaminoacyl peptidase
MIQLVRSLFCCSLLVFTLGLSAQDIYQAPPPAIADLVTAPQTPLVSVNSSGEWLLLLERPGYRTIEDLAQPELKLAGLRINPRTNGASRGGTYSGLSLQHTIKGEVKPIAGLPDDVVVENVSWSPDGMHITFTVRQSNGLELWLAEVASSKARKLTEAIVNDALSGIPYAWFSDNKTLLVRTIVADRGEAPLADLAPAGPVVQATDGSKAPVRTYQDLLKNPHDEALFAYYATGQLQLLDLATGKLQAFGAPGIYTTMDVSPDGSYVLLGKLNKPFSYLVPYYRFPVTYTIYDRAGTAIREVADIPLAENIPKGFGAVRLGPRSFQWRADKPATLFWTEAQDGGDPRAEVDVRDQLFYLASPFQGDPQPSVKLPLRFGGVDWGNDELAIAYEWWWSTRQQISSQFVPDRPGTKEVLYEGSFEDRYNDPGSFVTRENKYGREVLLTSGKGQTLYLTGEGASPEGDRPFLRAFDRKTKTTKELWRSQAPYYEQPVALIGSPDEQQVILRRQSKAEAPNYYLYNWGKQDLKPLTTFRTPTRRCRVSRSK